MQMGAGRILATLQIDQQHPAAFAVHLAGHSPVTEPELVMNLLKIVQQLFDLLESHRPALHVCRYRQYKKQPPVTQSLSEPPLRCIKVDDDKRAGR
ncbi:hypothetical protein [Aeromonas sobria]|uniref:hypothetical protein n=1 Tax=Aeromonas sobria TaxID=646 RepID=UPI001F03267A|nr:hypothetical protein [Aeromonas sobria]